MHTPLKPKRKASDKGDEEMIREPEDVSMNPLQIMALKVPDGSPEEDYMYAELTPLLESVGSLGDLPVKFKEEFCPLAELESAFGGAESLLQEVRSEGLQELDFEKILTHDREVLEECRADPRVGGPPPKLHESEDLSADLVLKDWLECDVVDDLTGEYLSPD